MVYTLLLMIFTWECNITKEDVSHSFPLSLEWIRWLFPQAAQQAAHEAQEALQQLEVRRAGRAKMAG